MSKVGREKTENIVCKLPPGEDEIGQLGVSFQQMLNELEEKEQLETNMLASEHLVAVGRLAAGVAHEINNPLGGMLNALNTFQRYSDTDDLGRETLILIKRGLHQIHETVSALLVEANPKSHSLSPEDIDDVHTLLLPDAKKKHIRLLWSNEIKKEISLPSSPIRQLLMNLSLNAVHASLDGGLVQCSVGNENGNLCIRVDNEGPAITNDRLLHLFEPFSDSATGNGLGLWVTYQIVQQLDGSIKVESPEGMVRFEVELPIMESV
jgi:signal transduction histidine kinase